MKCTHKATFYALLFAAVFVTTSCFTSSDLKASTPDAEEQQEHEAAPSEKPAETPSEEDQAEEVAAEEESLEEIFEEDDYEYDVPEVFNEMQESYTHPMVDIDEGSIRLYCRGHVVTSEEVCGSDFTFEFDWKPTWLVQNVHDILTVSLGGTRSENWPHDFTSGIVIKFHTGDQEVQIRNFNINSHPMLASGGATIENNKTHKIKIEVESNDACTSKSLKVFFAKEGAEFGNPVVADITDIATGDNALHMCNREGVQGSINCSFIDNVCLDYEEPAEE